MASLQMTVAWVPLRSSHLPKDIDPGLEIVKAC
jgi:hypothetical protein